MSALSAWAVDALERAGATFAEVVLPAFVGADVFNIDYKAALGLAASATVASVLKSVVAKFHGDPNSASLVG